ncbi:hypothetical protein ACSW8S_17620 (plasmid) [Clostridium perfringens]
MNNKIQIKGVCRNCSSKSIELSDHVHYINGELSHTTTNVPTCSDCLTTEVDIYENVEQMLC